MATSPTQRTLTRWRNMGYRAEVVERWLKGANVRKDLFGCIDVLAVKNGETVGIQSTSYSHVSERVAKIKEMPETLADLKAAGWRIIVEGWRKPKHRWECREVEL